MGSYKEVKGDLLALAREGEFEVVCHGCNCQKVMGAGIAGQIAKQFPEAYQVDKDDIRSAIMRYGSLSYFHNLKAENFIVNLYTQFLPGPNFNIVAFEASLLKLKLTFTPQCTIGLPQIGAGIGAGNWEEIKSVIQRVLSEYDVTVVIYDK